VEHIIYLMTRPDWDDDLQAVEDGFLSFCRGDPHIDVDEHDATLLDGDWWLNEEAGATFPSEVREFLAAHPRRRAAQPHMVAVPLEPVWKKTPTTIVLGRDDAFESDENIAECQARVADTRVWKTDHFALFTAPEQVAAVVLEVLQQSV
jgi:pimeloyl-ACP methyl ester carboxylesterase